MMMVQPSIRSIPIPHVLLRMLCSSSKLAITPCIAWNALQLINLATLILAGLYILDTAQRERAALAEPKEGIIGASQDHVAPDVEIGTYHTSSSANGMRSEDQGVGHAVNLPVDIEEQQAGNRMPDVYAEVTGGCTAAPAVWLSCPCVSLLMVKSSPPNAAS